MFCELLTSQLRGLVRGDGGKEVFSFSSCVLIIIWPYLSVFFRFLISVIFPRTASFEIPMFLKGCTKVTNFKFFEKLRFYSFFLYLETRTIFAVVLHVFMNRLISRQNYCFLCFITNFLHKEDAQSKKKERVNIKIV